MITTSPQPRETPFHGALGLPHVPRASRPPAQPSTGWSATRRSCQRSSPPPRDRSRFSRWALLLTLTTLWLSGCQELRLARTAITTEQATREDTAARPARAGLTLHPDGMGWSIRVVQPLITQALMHRDESWTIRPLTWHPLALLRSTVFCQGAILGSLLSPADADLADDILRTSDVLFWGCLSWTGLTPQNDRTQIETTTRLIQSSQTERPALTASIEATILAGSHPSLSYPLDETGQARIRLSHLALAAHQRGTRVSATETTELAIRVVDHGQEAARWTVPITGAQLTQSLQATRVAVPPAHWPQPLRIAMGPLPALAPTPARLLDTGLLQVFHRHQIPVVPSLTGQHLIHTEQRLHVSGLVDEQRATSLGHWTAPTALVFLDATTSAQRQSLSLQIVAVETGQILAVLSAEGHPQDFQGVLEELLGKLDTALPSQDHPVTEQP